MQHGYPFEYFEVDGFFDLDMELTKVRFRGTCLVPRYNIVPLLLTTKDGTG